MSRKVKTSLKHKKAFVKALTAKKIEVLLRVNNVSKNNPSYKILYDKLKKLRGPIPRNYNGQFYYPFAVRIKEANAAYEKRLSGIDTEINQDIADAKKDGEDYTLEEQNKARKFLKESALATKARSFAIAENHRNDLENYADSLLEDWSKYGGGDLY